jgi:uncharacterized protein
MTLLPSDETHAVQASAEVAAEPQTEYGSNDLSQPLETEAAGVVIESLPADPPADAPAEAPLLFANIFQPEPPPPPARVPHLGHVLLLVLYLVLSLFASLLFLKVAVHFHFFGATNLQAAMNDIHYALGYEVLIYFVTFAVAYFTFPLIWRKGFFTGLQWNGATALRQRWALAGTGFLCYVMAMVNIIFVPGPTNTPIEKIFKEPGAAWLLFIFGITVAPFFEELFFRGFLLPSLSTAYDWLAERFYHVPRRPLGPDGSPQWSLSAMAIASVVTSAPFALMHAEQTGNSADAVLLLACVSLVLCAVRLVTRSLAASVLVHAFYNLLIFSMMLLGTGGFQHFDKM